METTTQSSGLRRPRARLTRHLAALLCGAALLGGCGKSVGGGRGPERVGLMVDNRGFFDVTVYALRSSGGTGARLGNVSGGSMAALQVRTTDLQEGTRLVVLVRAIGTGNTWRSPGVSVSPGTMARLNVMTTNSGDLSQSTLILDYGTSGGTGNQ